MSNECMKPCPDHGGYRCELMAFHSGAHRTYLANNENPAWPVSYEWPREQR